MSGMVCRRAAKQLHRLLHCSCSSGVASSTAALASSGAEAATLISISSRSSSSSTLFRSIFAQRGYSTAAASWRAGSNVVASGTVSQLRTLSQQEPNSMLGLADAENSCSGEDNSSSSSSSATASSSSPQQRRKRGRPRSAVPAVDAEQLLHCLGLSSATSAGTLLRKMRQLPGVRQQSVVQHAAAVVQHLRSPAVDLDNQQVGQLLERCPELFSRPPEERAALQFDQLMATGLTAAEVAGCYKSFPPAAASRSFDAGIAELAAILAHSVDREGSGREAAVPAAERTVAALLRRIPSAIQLVAGSEGKLRQSSLELQQAGFSPTDVATLAWRQPEFLMRDSVAYLERASILLEKHLGLAPAHSLDLLVRRTPLWLTSSAETLEERIVALAEGFGKVAAAGMLTTCPAVLNCAPEVWRSSLHYMAACGVGSPAVVLARHPVLMPCDHAATSFVERRLLLQRYFDLTAAQLYGERTWCLIFMEPPKLAQRLQFIEHRGQLHRLVDRPAGRRPAAGAEERPLGMTTLLQARQPAFLAAVGATEEEWEAFAAMSLSGCTAYRWVQSAAKVEAQLLKAVLPPELQNVERRRGRMHMQRRTSAA